jgi:3'-phosphoadenosine 5'-phosphosulfate sulfotransferase (PAPS reductase)/FAD synthetase
MIYLSLLSGGQDSTAMTLRLLELGYPVDYIIFSDTGLEFDEMYEYLDKLDLFFQRKYGKKIIRLKPKKDFEYWAFGEVTRGENIGLIRGTPLVQYPCFWKKESKIAPFEKWLKKNNIKEHIKYIGYTFTELERAKGIEEKGIVAPLIDFKWTEKDVQKYLKDNMMENKLYQHFSRTGCSVCPKKTINEKYMVYKHYPEKWSYMVDVEHRLKLAREAKGQKHYPAWHGTLFTNEMEKLFKKKDKQQTFEFDFEPVQDCFCKI